MPAIVHNTPRTIEKPWGAEVIFAETPEYTFKSLYMSPGHKCSLQKHEYKKETITVVQGSMKLYTVDDEGHKHTDDIEVADSFTLLPGTVHRMANEGKELLVYMEVSTTFPDDIIRLEDAYQREGTTNA